MKNHDAFAARLQQFLTGEIEPPNLYCKHIVEKLQAIQGEADQKLNVLKQAQAALEQAQTRIVELRGQAKAYREDLLKFDKEILTEEKSEVAEQ